MKKASLLYKKPIGAYFYKYEEDELILLRLYKVKSENTYLLKDKNRKKVTLSKKQFEEFTMLEPDGVIVHVLASDPNQGIDTLCVLYNIKDLNNNISIPYAVCRQNIVDPFETILNNDPSTTYVGVSISKDTSPEGFDYNSVCIAAGIRDQRINFVYKEDTLDDILSFINTQPFDTALSIVQKHMSDSDGIKYKGFNNTYKELLEENDFMYDFKRCFGIIRFKLRIDTSIDRWTENGIYKITKDEVNIIESVTKHEVIAPILLKYDRTIDLSKIERTYILFEDLNKEVYIVSYDKGEYINREYDALDDKRDREVLLNVIKNGK